MFAGDVIYPVSPTQHHFSLVISTTDIDINQEIAEPLYLFQSALLMCRL